MNPAIKTRIREKLRALYGDDAALADIHALIERRRIADRSAGFDSSAPILIAYGDHLRSDDDVPLHTLHRFTAYYLSDLIGAIHILPCFPYSSDDGFSVIDYRAIDPALGEWRHVQQMGADFRLMLDLVLNHVSSQSAWFSGFLRGEAPYRDYVLTASPQADLSAVVRPRTHPLLTPYDTANSTQYVWTTFSADQIDLNYANPALLVEMLDILLLYVGQGADYIRLDAIAYLWKQIGTSSIHLPQTHTVVQLMRDVLDAAAPWVKLITETNVPHQENLSYFGNGYNEAQMVYQFALPPLLLHALQTGDGRTLTAWAAGLELPSDATAFFNFTASHDGIGVRPATGLLPDSEIDAVIERVKARGGQVSYKANSDGTQSAYELNITYFDALAVPKEPPALSVDRFVASQAVMLALEGAPGIYLPSLFGAANWQDGAAQTGRARTLNREKFMLPALVNLIGDPTHRYGQVFARYTQLLRLRATHPAFRQRGNQRVLDLHPSVFALERGDLLAIHNLSDARIQLQLPRAGQDLISGTMVAANVALAPYQVVWMV
jgi:glucosylglycerate phosphorylase